MRTTKAARQDRPATTQPVAETVATAADRRELLERLGAFYGEHGFALVWTESIGPSEKTTARRRWIAGLPGRRRKPLPHAARGVALMTSKGQSHNPGDQPYARRT